MNNNLFKSTVLILVMLIANCSLLIAQNRLDVIVLDAGHGGKDPGTISDFSGVQEKNIVLPITMKLGKIRIRPIFLSAFMPIIRKKRRQKRTGLKYTCLTGKGCRRQFSSR